MKRTPSRHRLGLATVVTVLLGPTWAVWAASGPAAHLDFPIVFAQIPAGGDLENRPGRAEGMLRADYGDGAHIVRLDPDGRLRVLTEGFAGACEFDISFDGERILFAAKQKPQDAWNIWEMHADGSGARQITQSWENCRNPAYQATLYTIISTEPWYQIMFVRDRAFTLNEYGSGPAMNLYSCKLDGSALRRLTLNLSDDLDPFLMDDGRVLLASWQRMDLRRGARGRIALFAVNTDGTDYALFCGEPGRRIKHMPCVTTDGLVVFVEADAVGWDGAGQLAAVTLRRNFHSYRPITHDEQRLYHSPSPLRDGTLLVSIRPAGEPVPSATHGIYRLDPRTGQAELLFDDPQFHDLHAKALVARPEPDGRSSVVNETYPTGKLYCLNAYLTDPTITEQLRPGMIRGLRVIEGVPPPAEKSAAGPTSGAAAPRGPLTLSVKGGLKSAAGVRMAQRRLLGQVPVEEDGSFFLELPADVPIQLQTLDADGMALESCGWIWVKHHEPRGCIGCHEDPELTPENRFVLALQHPAMELTLPAEKRRTVDFRRDIMPTMTQKCASCHTGKEGGLDLRDVPEGHFTRAYESLLAGSYVDPGQARTSPLIWRIFGRNTSRPWDPSYRPEQNFPVCPPPEAAPLTDDEKRALVEWIDLGAPWAGLPASQESPAKSDTGTKREEER